MHDPIPALRVRGVMGRDFPYDWSLARDDPRPDRPKGAKVPPPLSQGER